MVSPASSTEDSDSVKVERRRRRRRPRLTAGQKSERSKVRNTQKMSSTADVLSGVSGNAVSPKSKRSRQRKTGPLTPEERAYIQALFHDGEIDRELRDMLAGSQSFLSWSSGTEGGYLVPMEYQEQLAEASAQMDPLLDESAVELIREKSLACRPKQLLAGISRLCEPASWGRRASGAVRPTTAGRRRCAEWMDAQGGNAHLHGI